MVRQTHMKQNILPLAEVHGNNNFFLK